MLSLVILRPVSVLVLGYALLTVARNDIRECWPLVALANAAVALAILHLVPLPPALWHSLPGRETIATIDRMLGLEGHWRPLSLAPQATRNSLMALAAPCATLALAIRLDRRALETMLAVMLGVGALSAVWALLQLLGSPRGPLYLYHITNYGAPVGLFANRNHQAVFLASLIPLAYAWTRLAHGAWNDLRSPKGRRTGIAVAGIVLLVPLVLISGSRAGLLTLGLEFCATAALVILEPPRMRGGRRSARGAVSRFAPAIAGAIVLAGLAVVTIGVGRDRAFERLIGADPIADSRADLVPAVWRVVTSTFPWGTGVGSFDNAYRMYEPDALLMPNYINHAHNDFLELVMTAGLAGAVIAICAVILLVHRVWIIGRGGRHAIGENVWAIASLLALVALLVASLADYPLRTPALASYGVLLAVWACRCFNPQGNAGVRDTASAERAAGM